MGHQRFCSVRCYRMHTGETVPERNVRLALERLSVAFVQEAAIDGWRGLVDFLLTDLNVALEVDEPYWHDKVADRDARKNAFLAERGFTVVRLVATPFYGDFTDPMIGLVAAEIPVRQDVIANADVLRSDPVQPSLPFDEEWMVGSGGNP
ncbi:MAG TPA: DUF559 domain-containing protein [Jiangellaceae bacterium]|nr:DUF559 domain-containing protein [Jiangellaceae bacterium]